MAEFIYRGRDPRGQRVDGVISAGSSHSALEQLQQQQIIVLALDEAREAPPSSLLSITLWSRERISADELILLTRQLYSLTKAGVPIIRALTGLAESSVNVAIRKTLNGIKNSLISGSDLVTAFRQFPQYFSPIFISMIHIGETTGHLSDALLKLITHLEMERETRKRIKAALRYPSMVVGSISIAMVVITLFVIPSFSNVFNNLGAELPWATQVLMGTSAFMQNNWPFLLVMLSASFFAFRHYIKTPQGALFWDKKKLKMPILGGIFERIALARFSRSFAMLMAAGVPILQGLSIVADSVGNRFIGAAVKSMQQGIERGDRLTNTAVATGLFTPLVLQMMSVGEETGAIDSLLDEVADFYEQEIDYDLKRLADAIEPILLVFLGVMVLVLALGVFLPIWDLSRVATGR
ncbi:MAG: type II secretion system F family protein [Saccharospirillaceae bacterium]|nr:type II secretion system F family protein [Saccharospirillaceae bacterium]